MSTLCPTGGSYWNPKCCWWCTNSWLCTAFTRIYDVLRIVGWILGRIVDAVLTLIFQVIVPFLRFVFLSAIAFINFMVGLLLGEFRLEITILFPLFLFIGSWLLWLFWPEISCFFENVYFPLTVSIIRALGPGAGLAITLFNVVIRIWNSLVPVVGFLIYIVVELVVMFMEFTVELLGEFDVFAIFNSLIEIGLLVVNIVIEVLVAVVAATPTLINALIDAVGPTVTVLIASARILLAVTVWVFGALWAALEPILELVVKVVRFVKKHFFLGRALLSLDAQDGMDDIDADLWRTMGQSSMKYWDETSAAQGIRSLEKINKWHMENRPAATLDYYWFRRSQLMRGSQSYDRGGGGGRNLFGLPTDWTDGDDDDGGGEERRADAAPTAADHLDDMQQHLFDTYRAGPDHPISLADEVATHHVMCKSRRCGGHGAKLVHPIGAVIDDHESVADHLYGLDRHDTAAHRRRLTHTITLAHALKKSVGRTVDTHWHGGDGTVSKHASRAFHRITGHCTVMAWYEHATSHHAHPVDSVLAHVMPAPSDWALVRTARAYLNDEHEYGLDDDADQPVHHVNWMRQRRVFTHPADGRLHVTRDPVPHDQRNHDHVMSRRGPFDPGRPGSGIPAQAADEDVPSLPVWQLLYTQDCFTTTPRNVLCLPELSPQLACFLTALFEFYPNEFPLEVCEYEEECTDLGFCIVERPPITPDLISIINNPELWLSPCWLKNGLVWIGVVLAIIFPVVKLTFQVLGALLPFLSPIFDAFIGLIPDLVQWQDLICLFPFLYGFVLLVILTYLASFFVVPLFRFLRRSFTTLEAMFGAIRSIEASRLAYLEQSGSRRLIENFWRVNHRAVLHADPWTQSPLIAPQPSLYSKGYENWLAPKYDQAARLRAFQSPGGPTFMPYIPLTGGFEPSPDDLSARAPLFQPQMELQNRTTYAPLPLAAEIDAAGAEEAAVSPADEPVSPEAAGALAHFRSTLLRGRALFGEPSGVVTYQHVYAFEVRFRPLIHPVFYSMAWMSKYINEHHHQVEKARVRKPGKFIYLRGMFDAMLRDDGL